MIIDLTLHREAIEASWDEKTSYNAVSKQGNPALGQCYPTSRILQFFSPKQKSSRGRRGRIKVEKHCWNVIKVGETKYHIDFTSQQFPASSEVHSYKIHDRKNLGDGPATIERCGLLRNRVLDYIATKTDSALL